MSDETQTAPVGGKFKSLGVRTASGVGLILLCGLPIYFGGWAMIVLVALFGGGMLWEWTRMTDVQFSKISVFIPIATLWLGLALVSQNMWQWALASVLVGSVLALAERLRRGMSWWPSFGVFYIALPCLALIWLRGDIAGFQSTGFAKLVFVMAIVIAADSFAYFGGSTLKGPKFAPKISPNKTWSGFLCGIAAAAIVGVVGAKIIGFSLGLGAILAVPIAVASVFGDLLESAIKRHLNVKDAGGLLPGHGGLLDRLDSLLLAVLTAVIALLLFPGLWPV